MKKIFLNLMIVVIFMVCFSLNVKAEALSSTKWNLYFENIQIKEGSVTAVNPPEIKGSSNSEIDFDVNLNVPGDFYEFTVDITNAGTMDAMVSEINNNQLTDNQKRYLSYEVTYLNGNKVQKNDLLKAGITQRIKIRIEFKKDINPEDLPNENTLISLALNASYVQADNNANEPETDNPSENQGDNGNNNGENDNGNGENGGSSNQGSENGNGGSSNQGSGNENGGNSNQGSENENENGGSSNQGSENENENGGSSNQGSGNGNENGGSSNQGSENGNGGNSNQGSGNGNGGNSNQGSSNGKDSNNSANSNKDSNSGSSNENGNEDSSKTSKDDKKTGYLINSVKTGDEIIKYVVIFLLSIIAILFTIYKTKKDD